MSVNVFLTRREVSGTTACEIHALFFFRFFVEMCHNTTGLCVCMFACHVQSELKRVEASVTCVRAQERVASMGVWQQVAEREREREECVCGGG